MLLTLSNFSLFFLSLVFQFSFLSFFESILILLLVFSFSFSEFVFESIVSLSLLIHFWIYPHSLACFFSFSLIFFKLSLFYLLFLIYLFSLPLFCNLFFNLSSFLSHSLFLNLSLPTPNFSFYIFFIFSFLIYFLINPLSQWSSFSAFHMEPVKGSSDGMKSNLISKYWHFWKLTL